jgi:hypothetical protein
MRLKWRAIDVNIYYMKEKSQKSVQGGKKETKKKELKIDWLAKLLFNVWPKMGVKYLAFKMGIDDSDARNSHDLFSKVKRIDIFPAKSGLRGFIIILDNKTGLYFFQDGDHFKYDGYELGSYKKGDVTLFDRVETKESHTYL